MVDIAKNFVEMHQIYNCSVIFLFKKKEVSYWDFGLLKNTIIQKHSNSSLEIDIDLWTTSNSVALKFWSSGYPLDLVISGLHTKQVKLLLWWWPQAITVYKQSYYVQYTYSNHQLLQPNHAILQPNYIQKILIDFLLTNIAHFSSKAC